MDDSSSGESRSGEVGGAVTPGLPAAWALHDGEELATRPGWWRRNLPARHRPRRAGVPRPTRPRDFARGLGLAGASAVAAHTVARRLTGVTSARPR
ncbi:HXXEE domain-containing protein [Streptomyces sp. NBC_01723]|uniref:HXXEE domain-containing protein n=1 Tax=Streptomyces sp. NBC_01723 TaxID=2975921 RepID=UPI002E3420E3|nr:HXXEE domain-containing protein [Streptomyces sp. NBC_01723]